MCGVGKQLNVASSNQLHRITDTSVHVLVLLLLAEGLLLRLRPAVYLVNVQVRRLGHCWNIIYLRILHQTIGVRTQSSLGAAQA